MQMAEFTQYRKKQLAEMRPYVAGEPLVGVSIADVDRQAGSAWTQSATP
jgi:hypothetical protein